MSWLRDLIREWPWVALAVVFTVAGVGLYALAGASGNVQQVGLFSVLLDLLLIPAAVTVLFVALRLRDRLAGFRWGALRKQLIDGNLPVAIYLSAWVLAVALIVSSVLG